MTIKPRRKKSRSKRKPSNYIMVIRVSVSAEDAKSMRVSKVLGRLTTLSCESVLPILDAHYERLTT